MGYLEFRVFHLFLSRLVHLEDPFLLVNQQVQQAPLVLAHQILPVHQMNQVFHHFLVYQQIQVIQTVQVNL